MCLTKRDRLKIGMVTELEPIATRKRLLADLRRHTGAPTTTLFLSHCGADKELAVFTLLFLRGLGFDVVFDITHVDEVIDEQIFRLVRDADWVLALVTAEFLDKKSKWGQNEVAECLGVYNAGNRAATGTAKWLPNLTCFVRISDFGNGAKELKESGRHYEQSMVEGGSREGNGTVPLGKVLTEISYNETQWAKADFPPASALVNLAKHLLKDHRMGNGWCCPDVDWDPDGALIRGLWQGAKEAVPRWLEVKEGEAPSEQKTFIQQTVTELQRAALAECRSAESSRGSMDGNQHDSRA